MSARAVAASPGAGILPRLVGPALTRCAALARLKAARQWRSQVTVGFTGLAEELVVAAESRTALTGSQAITCHELAGALPGPTEDGIAVIGPVSRRLVSPVADALGGSQRVPWITVQTADRVLHGLSGPALVVARAPGEQLDWLVDTACQHEAVDAVWLMDAPDPRSTGRAGRHGVWLRLDAAGPSRPRAARAAAPADWLWCRDIGLAALIEADRAWMLEAHDGLARDLHASAPSPDLLARLHTLPHADAMMRGEAMGALSRQAWQGWITRLTACTGLQDPRPASAEVLPDRAWTGTGFWPRGTGVDPSVRWLGPVREAVLLQELIWPGPRSLAVPVLQVEAEDRATVTRVFDEGDLLATLEGAQVAEVTRIVTPAETLRPRRIVLAPSAHAVSGEGFRRRSIALGPIRWGRP